MDVGWYGDADLLPAVDALAARPDVDPTRIGIVGISLGGMEAIGAAAADPRLRAVVAEDATRRSDADLAWLPEVYGPSGAAQLAINRLQFSVTGLLAGTPPPPSLADAVAHAAEARELGLEGGDVRAEHVPSPGHDLGHGSVDLAPHRRGLAREVVHRHRPARPEARTPSR